MSCAANKFGKDEMLNKHNNIISAGGTFHTFVRQKSICVKFFIPFILELFHLMRHNILWMLEE